MKKLIQKLLLFACLLLMVPTGAFLGTERAHAETQEQDYPVYNKEFVYEKYYDNVRIVKYVGTSEKPSIPSKIEGCPVVRISEDAFANNAVIRTVTIPNTVKSIEDGAFEYCERLESITIPGSVESIEKYAFDGCRNLKSVTLSEGLNRISYYAFRNCIRLKQISIPKTVNDLQYSAFMFCESLTSINVDQNSKSYSSVSGVLFNKNKTKLIIYPMGKTGESYTVPEGVERLEKCAFEYNITLKEVKLPSTLTRIDNYAFANNPKLSSVNLPESLTVIGTQAFYCCAELKQVSIPKNVTTIGTDAFTNCTSITSFRVASDNANFCSVSGVLFSKDKKTLICYPSGSTTQKYSIPKGTETISENSFYGCHNLKELVIASSVKDISYNSFQIVKDITVGQKYTPLKVTNQSGVVAAFNSFDPTYLKKNSDGSFTAIKPGLGMLSSGDPHVLIALRVMYKDVKVEDSTYYAAPVYRATLEGITEGVRNPKTGLYETFNPQGNCTRAQMATFLWRMMNRPEPKKTTSSFTDLDKSAYYYKAVLWGEENGIISGYSDHTFRPNGTCTRQQAVTFLWRIAGEPEPLATKSSFTDVKDPKTYFYKAVLWASENGITYGYSDNTFRPTNICSRAQMITFLDRYRHPGAWY